MVWVVIAVLRNAFPPNYLPHPPGSVGTTTIQGADAIGSSGRGEVHSAQAVAVVR